MTGRSVCRGPSSASGSRAQARQLRQAARDQPEQTAAEQMLDRWTSLLDDRYTRRNATVTMWRAV